MAAQKQTSSSRQAKKADKETIRQEVFTLVSFQFIYYLMQD